MPLGVEDYVIVELMGAGSFFHYTISISHFVFYLIMINIIPVCSSFMCSSRDRCDTLKMICSNPDYTLGNVIFR
jgi:hypothetical protein